MPSADGSLHRTDLWALLTLIAKSTVSAILANVPTTKVPEGAAGESPAGLARTPPTVQVEVRAGCRDDPFTREIHCFG
jgi:hypothetical protein